MSGKMAQQRIDAGDRTLPDGSHRHRASAKIRSGEQRENVDRIRARQHDRRPAAGHIDHRRIAEHLGTGVAKDDRPGRCQPADDPRATSRHPPDRHI